MRFLVLAASVPGAFAIWNQELCSGAGACVDVGHLVQDPFRCPDGSSITLPDFGNDLQAAGSTGATLVSKAEFPTSCFAGAVPGPNARLVRTKTRNGQTAYSFVTENCLPKDPAAVAGDCYNFNTNPSTYTFCQLIDASGGQCATNPQAGRCERWGNTAGRTECAGWKIGQADYPDTA
ncbi:hypothetical protein T440DRAFT_419679 [Plenodomus tracheiphilus IPT5]|uniref:Uncharacterized protein n=1 Tax=Plenodomus tracheiphilus IPT5 TaxID=1408161 RepID=A0A6A7BBY7_9PLEO|nr:hypothetical protein T440DRAFT_419679 [Plenodomus tracheiphilus IPT5]